MLELAQLLGQVELVESYIDMEDWRVRENANMIYSLQGLNNYLAGTVVANYWLSKLYPPEAARRAGKATFTTSACWRRTVAGGTCLTCC